METLELIKPKTEIATIADKIETGLQAFEERKAELIELQKKATGLKITSIEDRASINLVSLIRKELKAARVAIEKEGKSMRDPLTGINKNIKAKEDELVAIIEPTEKELAIQEKWVADEKEKIEKAKAEAERLRIQARIDTLAAFGFYIDYTTIMSIDDATFATVVKNAEAEYNKELAAKAEERRLAELEAEKLKAERLELEKLRAEQAEAQRIINENNVRIEREQKEKEAAIVAEQKRMEGEKLAIELAAQKAEENRLRLIQLEEEKATAAEQARLKAIADAKADAEQKERELAAAKIEVERQAALRPDKEKLESFAQRIGAVIDFKVNDEKAQAIINDVSVMIGKIQIHILRKIKEL